MAAHELADGSQVGAGNWPCLDLDGPRAPRALENGIHLEWLLAPVPHLLPGVPCVREASVLNPCAEARRIVGCARSPARVRDGEERVTQGHDLRWRGAAASWRRGMLEEWRDQVRLLKEVQVMRDRIQRARVLKLSLDLLQGEDLSRRRCADTEDLSEQRGS